MSEQDNENDYTIVFDHFYTNNHIQILKSLLPFFPANQPSYLPVLIKFLELQYTLSLAKKGIPSIKPDITASGRKNPDLNEIHEAVKKYLAPGEEKSFQQLLSMIQTFENVKEMQKMMEMFQSMNGSDEPTANPFPDLSELEHMLEGNPDMKEMIQLLNMMKQ